MLSRTALDHAEIQVQALVPYFRDFLKNGRHTDLWVVCDISLRFSRVNQPVEPCLAIAGRSVRCSPRTPNQCDYAAPA